MTCILTLLHITRSLIFCKRTCVTYHLTALHSTPPKSEAQGPGHENESLLENLTVLGVDVRMVRRRQPGVLKRSVTNEHGLMHFLQSKGASREMVASIISRFPRAITRSGEHLEQRWELWRRVFKSDGEIVNILARSPESFFRSSDNGNLKKNIVFLGSLGLSSKDLYRLLTTAPRTFSNSLELNQQMVELLREVCLSLGGKDPDQFVRAIISRNSYVLIRSTKRIKGNVSFLQDTLGLSSSKLLELLQGQGAEVLDLSNEYLLNNFRDIQQKLLSQGCSQDDVKTLIIKYPPVLFISRENLRNKIDCLQDGGINIKQIIQKPKVLEFSIDNLKRRLKELQEIAYDFEKNGIGILDSSQRRFDAKLLRLSGQ